MANPVALTYLEVIVIEARNGAHAMAVVGNQSTASHRRSVVASTADIAGFLQDALGQKLVAFMVGVSDPKTVGRWASGARTPRGSSVEQRLRAAHQVFGLLATAEAPDTVRAWFVGLNPQLDDESPAQAIREDRAKEVLIAARAFLAGG